MDNQTYSPEITSDDKLWVLLAYIFSPLVPILIMLMEDKKNRPFIRYHAIQALILNLAIYVLMTVLTVSVVGAIVGDLCDVPQGGACHDGLDEQETHRDGYAGQTHIGEPPSVGTDTREHLEGTLGLPTPGSPLHRPGAAEPGHEQRHGRQSGFSGDHQRQIFQPKQGIRLC